VVMAVILAIYGFVDIILLLAAKVVGERVKPYFTLWVSARIGNTRVAKKERLRGCAIQENQRCDAPK